MDANFIQKITIYAIPLIFAITLHEAAHAFAARYFGDATAYMLGRMTLNPLKHIDGLDDIGADCDVTFHAAGIRGREAGTS